MGNTRRGLIPTITGGTSGGPAPVSEPEGYEFVVVRSSWEHQLEAVAPAHDVEWVVHTTQLSWAGAGPSWKWGNQIPAGIWVLRKRSLQGLLTWVRELQHPVLLTGDTIPFNFHSYPVLEIHDQCCE